MQHSVVLDGVLIFVGEVGSMLLGHINGPIFFPGSVYDKFKKPDLKLLTSKFSKMKMREIK